MHQLMPQGHVGSKTFLQQNPTVLNWGCQLTWDDLYNSCKTTVVVAVGCILVFTLLSVAIHVRHVAVLHGC